MITALTRTPTRPRSRSHLIEIGLLLISIGLLWAVLLVLPVTYADWFNYFGPAARRWFDPYSIHGVLNPPWTFLLLAPLGQLPGSAGPAALQLIIIGAIMLYVRSPLKLLAVVSSVPFVFDLVVGQLDGLAIVGLLIPSGLGLPLLLIKPQAAALTALTRLNKWSLLSLGLVGAASILIWGFWWWQIDPHGYNPDPSRNLSLFPYPLPLAAALAWWGVKRKSDALLCAATLCLSPFFQIHSMLPLAAATARDLPARWVWLLPVMSWLLLFLF